MVEVVGKGTTITSGIDDPEALALDKQGNLYVGSSTSPTDGSINVFAPNTTTPARTIANLAGEPHGLAVNAAGRLYSALQVRYKCCDIIGKGMVYKAGTSTLLQKLEDLSGFAHDLVFDKAGNLYVANFDVMPGWISIYKRGDYVPSTFVHDGIGFPLGMTVAPNGELVVASSQANHSVAVTVYPPGQTSPSLTITQRIVNPDDVAIDTAGNIYVANTGTSKIAGWITVYRNGRKNVWRTIRTGVNYPVRVALDGQGRLYVANSPSSGTNTVTVYARNGSTPIATYQLKEDVSQMLVPQ
jgi:serine/threonine protein kinase, bacterial